MKTTITTSNQPRINSQWTWLCAGAIAVYAIVASVGVLVFHWNSSLDVAVPALAIAGWMEYVYLRYRDTGPHRGLLISGLGWLAIAIAFLLRGSEPALYYLRLAFSAFGFGAILGGGITAYGESQTVRIELELPAERSEDAAQPTASDPTRSEGTPAAAPPSDPADAKLDGTT